MTRHNPQALYSTNPQAAATRDMSESSATNPGGGGFGKMRRNNRSLDNLTCAVTGVVDNTVVVRRFPVTQVKFDEIHQVKEKPKRTLCEVVKSKLWCDKRRLWKLTTTYIPVIKFIRYFNIKEWAIIEIMAGLCVGILHIPQGLAFGSLAAVRIENGLYTSIWPVLIYIFFGTSPHISMGTSAVVAILTGSVVNRLGEKYLTAHPELLNFSSAANGTDIDLDSITAYMDYKVNISMGVAFISGLIMIIMGILKLGFITWYLSDSFFAAFTSAAAIHIATSQFPPMLGIKITRYNGMLKIIYSWIAIFSTLDKTNIGALICSILTCVVILIVKDGINERFKHKLPAPIPVELFVVIIGALAGYYGNLKAKYKIDNVGKIPNTIPMPVVPDLSESSTYIVDGFVLAIIIFAYSIAMAKICAKKHNYEVNDSQELIAYGLCNFGSSFLRCFPSATAPPRTMVASMMNAKTTLSGIFCVILMLLVVLAISFCFEPLPKSVLAAIIFVALKGLFIQIGDCVKYWRINKFDFVIWFCTIVSVVVLDIDVGLGIGVGVSLVTVVFQSQFSRGYRIGRTPNDSALVEHKRYPDSREIPGVKIFRFQGNLFFANAEIFRNRLYLKTLNPRKLYKALTKREAKMKKLGLLPQPDSNGHVDAEATTNGHANGVFTVDGNAQSPGRAAQFTVGADNHAFTIADEVRARNVPFSYLSNGTNGVLSDIETHRTDSLGKLHDSEPEDESEVSEEEDPEDGDTLFTDERLREMMKIRYLIVDCATINYLDASGAIMLSTVFGEFAQVNITVFLAHCSHDMRVVMTRAGVYNKIPKENVFLELNDAVARARLEQVLNPERLANFTNEKIVGDVTVTKL